MGEERLPGIRPRQSFGRRLDIGFRQAFPAATTAVALLLAAGPIGVPGQAGLQAALALVAVFFWSVFRPTSLPAPVVFLLGLFADLLGYGPVGIDVLALLLVHGLALRWRRTLVQQGFLRVWLTFMALSAGAAALQWALTSLLTLRLLPGSPALFEAALSAGLYPLLAAPLARVNATVADPERA
jgi:rod shape-determining protein MreD